MEQSLSCRCAGSARELRGSRAGTSGADRGFEALNARIGQIERTVEEMRRHISHFEHNVAADLVDIERSIKAQAAAIESSRTAMSQTDDLVERVVEALESLQTTVLEEGEGVKRSRFSGELGTHRRIRPFDPNI